MPQALILIDLQNDYFSGGAMELSGSSPAVEKAGELLQAFRQKSLPIVHLQHVATRPGATFFRPDTPGAEIHSAVAPLAGETIFQKHFPNSFRETPLQQHLSNLHVSHLVIAGMMTHMCVDSTVRAAADLGFRCTLAHDACATRALSFGEITVTPEQVQAAFLASLQGLFARVLSAKDTIAGLSTLLQFPG